MKKDKTMKKSGLVKGAFIVTAGIVLSKILGILYVIPFHAIIGDLGGALYGYAYTIYLLFISLSTAGIPLAISKLVSEYHTMGYVKTKQRAYFLGKRLACILGVLFFLILVIFAPFIARAILGDLTGGNSLSDVTFVIRVIATAILIVPLLSIYRGYLEGHRFMEVVSISQVLEQLIRVLVIVFGSYLGLKVFKLNLRDTIGIAVFGATVGALVAYFYLFQKVFFHKKKFQESTLSVHEKKITDKEIIRKIIIYAIPFILIDLFKSLYNYIDMTTVVEALVKFAHFSVSNAEVVMSMFSTWGAKFNMILSSVSTGIIVSLIPSLTSSLIKKDEKGISSRIVQSFNMLLYLTIPMTIGLSFLAKPVWSLFYGDSVYGASVLSYYIFVGLLMGIFTLAISIIQVLKDYKTLTISLVSGFLIKLLFNVNLIQAFYKMGLPAYYGSITASILAYFISLLICLITLYKKYHIHYEEVVKNLIDILCGSILMVACLLVLKLIVPVYSAIRGLNIVIIFCYTLVGSTIYFYYTNRTKTFKRVFGTSFKSFIKKLKK